MQKKTEERTVVGTDEKTAETRARGMYDGLTEWDKGNVIDWALCYMDIGDNGDPYGLKDFNVAEKIINIKRNRRMI